MSKVPLNKANIEKLLTIGEDIEFEEEQSDSRFNFSDFYHKKIDLLKGATINSCLTFMKNKQAIAKIVKTSDFKFGNIKIKKNQEKVGNDDMTFRRLDAMIRIKVVEHSKDAAKEMEVREKMKTHPLVLSYGLKLESGRATRLACLLGGSLPLLASEDNFEIISLVLAIYQDGKAKELGIDTTKYNTGEAVAKVCTVLKSKEFKFTNDQLQKAQNYVDILKACDPKMKGMLAVEHYSSQLTKIYEMMGVTGTLGSIGGGPTESYV